MPCCVSTACANELRRMLILTRVRGWLRRMKRGEDSGSSSARSSIFEKTSPSCGRISWLLLSMISMQRRVSGLSGWRMRIIKA